MLLFGGCFISSLISISDVTSSKRASFLFLFLIAIATAANAIPTARQIIAGISSDGLDFEEAATITAEDVAEEEVTDEDFDDA